MKRFQIITEADARVLEYGSTVALAPGGHVTPLALDTLRARRVQVIRDEYDADLEGLAPASPVRRLALSSDHTGIALRGAIRGHLRGRGVAVDDLGTDETGPVDYPDTAAAAARQVSRGEADAAIVIDGSGLGSAMAANKLPGVRAAMCTTDTLARYARQHTGANVLALGSTLLTADEAVAVVDAFLDTSMREARYIRRLAKLHALERPAAR